MLTPNVFFDVGVFFYIVGFVGFFFYIVQSGKCYYLIMNFVRRRWKKILISIGALVFFFNFPDMILSIVSNQ